MSIELVNASGFIETQQLDVGLYPDNTPVVNLEQAWNRAAGKYKAIVIRPRTMQDFFTGMMVVDTIRNRGGRVDHLVLPYIPGARQDRQKWEGDWLETLRFVGKTINSMRFDSVMVADPHSATAFMAIDRMREFYVSLAVSSYFQKHKYDYVVAPDAGAVERAGRVAERLGVPLLTATKHRDPETNKLSGFSLETSLPTYEKHVLFVDDICDAGGTFVGLAAILKPRYMSADLFVTHGLFSKGTSALLEAFDKVYSTDSLNMPADGVNYINITDRMINSL